MPRICVPATAERREADSADPGSRLQGAVCSRMVPNSHRRSPKTTVGAGFTPSNRPESLRGGTIQTSGWASVCGGGSVRRQHARVTSRSRPRSPSPIRSPTNVSAEVTLGGPSRGWRGGGERSGRSPLLPPTPPLSWALKPASIAGLHRPNRSSSHTFLVADISRRAIRDLSCGRRLPQGPFSLPLAGRKSPSAQLWGSFNSPFLSAQIAACVRSLTPSRWKALPR
jgi:hypothetical protein